MKKYRFHDGAYVHNLLADVINTTLKWIQEELCPSARYALVSTYDKAVERLKILQEEDPNVPPLPAITLDPQQPTIPDATVLWRFSQLSSNPVVTRTHEPIIETDDFRITPIFQPVRVEMETIFFLSSIYEYLDLSVRIFDFFGGVNRWVRPRIVSSYIIVPSTLYGETYEDPYTGTSYTIDLTSVSDPQLIKSLAGDYVCFETLLTPRFQLTGVSDGSTKYGADTVADWRATFSMVMELYLPTWFIFETDVKISVITVEGRVSGSYYPNEISDDGRIIDKPSPVKDIVLPQTNQIVTFKDRFIYTADQDYNAGELVLNLPINLDSKTYLIVWSYGGEMTYQVHYTIDTSSDPNTITFLVNFQAGDVIEFYYYEE